MQISQEPIVSIQDSSIYQGNKVILKNINVDIEKGEFVFLVGRTGSGKSSLLKTLYADIPLYEGAIQIVGYDIKNIKKKQVPMLRRNIGIIFQDFQLLNDRSVAENLFFVMKATGWKDKASMKARLTEVLMKVGLGSVAQKMPHQLSGGEQQRTVIARALINEPSILIADEPTGNLDPEVADGIVELFNKINSSGTAILMATHNYDFLKKYTYRVLRCEEGKLIENREQDQFNNN